MFSGVCRWRGGLGAGHPLCKGAPGLLTSAKCFSTWNAATAKTLATADTKQGSEFRSPELRAGSTALHGPQLTEDQAQGRPAIRVLQEQRQNLDGIHQDAVPAGSAGVRAGGDGEQEERAGQGLGDAHLMRFSRNNRALLRIWGKKAPRQRHPCPHLQGPLVSCA